MREAFVQFYARLLRFLYRRRAKRMSFDLRALDKKVSWLADLVYDSRKDDFLKVGGLNNEGVCFLATELYDSGGHTECLRALIESLAPYFKLKLVLAHLGKTERLAPVKLSKIRDYCSVSGTQEMSDDFSGRVVTLFNEIVAASPKVLFSYVHMGDILGATVLSLVKSKTDIKILFFNHGSHVPALAFSFVDLVIEGMPSTHYLTKEFRGVDRGCVLGLQSLAVGETVYFSDKERTEVRKGWRVSPEELVTMTGCSSAKLFDGKKSPYFEMILRLLLRLPNLKHVVVSSLSRKQRKIVKRIFRRHSDAFKRLVFAPMRPDYDILFQSCDVFIDSFPVSSALTQIDLMRNRVPSVVKINAANAAYSFHEYLPSNYPYMFSDVAKLEEAVVYLLLNKGERERVVDINYNHFLEKYEKNRVRDRYIEIIRNADQLEKFYEPSPVGAEYSFLGISK